MNWSITESPGLIGELAVAPSSGRLLAGQSTTIGLRVSAGAGALTALAARAGAALAGVCVSCTAHRQSRRHHGHGPHRGQRQPELSGPELPAAELAEPGNRDRQRVP